MDIVLFLSDEGFNLTVTILIFVEVFESTRLTFARSDTRFQIELGDQINIFDLPNLDESGLEP